MPALILKDERLSQARHNLRTPINHILGYGEMLMEDAGERGHEEYLPRLQRIIDGGHHALAIINSALTPSTNQVGEPELVAMRDALLAPVNEILETLRDFECKVVSSDIGKIRTAAERLLAMANEVTASNGAAPAQEGGEAKPQSASAPDRLKPVPQVAQQHVLESDLALGRQQQAQAVSVPDGHLHVQPASAATGRKPAPHGHLLVVDDNETNRDVLGRRLEREGYQVSAAENGRRALEMLRGGRFDLALLDIMMPEIDGYEVLRQMKADPALCDIPVIMISALDEIASVVRCIETGAEDYLTKPFDPVLLRARIGACLEKKRLRDQQKHAMDEAESLLKNILPAQVAVELRERGQVEPRYFEDVTILFSDFVGFTRATEDLAAEELVTLLHRYFTAFDQIVGRYGLEKLKTIGDSYMLAGGLPERNPSHPVDAVMAAFEMIKAVEEISAEGTPWKVRVGIHTGPVIAGVVGIKKFAFDVWGETVNFSSRMESAGVPNRVNLSARTYSRVKDFFECEPRGQVTTKEGKAYDMYFAKGIHPKLVGGEAGAVPAAFERRYRIYFQKSPPAFPGFLLDPKATPA